jgi:hypothetical protein
VVWKGKNEATRTTGYLTALSRPELVVHFFREIVGVAEVSKEALSQRTADYQNWVETYNPVEAVIDEDQEVAEQLGEQIHGSPLDTRQGSKGDPASTGQTDVGGEELSPRRRGPLHPAPGC